MKPNLQTAAPGMTIYFGTIVTNKAVHVQALGFTTQFYKYACAPSEREAEQLIAQWATENECDVKRVYVTPQGAVNQDINTYTFPHQIINLPKEVLDALYRYRNYPKEWCDAGRHIQLPSSEVPAVSM